MFKKIKNLLPQEQIRPHEKYLYGVGVFGQNILYTILVFALQMFYTDVLKIAPIIVGVVLFTARIFDAATDPIMGNIVDRTRTKWGKCRPYLLFAPFPAFLLTVLCFTNFNLSPGWTICYVVVTYNLWGLIYTVGDIPLWGLTSLMTDNKEEKNKIITVAWTVGGIANGLVMFTFLTFVGLFAKSGKSFFVDSDSKGYFYAALVLGLAGLITFMFAFVFSKERVKPLKEVNSFKQNIKIIAKNKPFLRLMLSNIAGALYIMQSASVIYYAKWVLANGDEIAAGLYTMIIMVVSGVSNFAAMLATPAVVKKVSKKKLYLYSCYISAAPLILIFLIPTTSLVVIGVALFIAGFGTGFITVMQSSMIDDCITYQTWKTGDHIEGMAFSGQTFSAKLKSGLVALAIMAILQIFNYNVDALNAAVDAGKKIAEEFPAVSKSMYAMLTLIPGLGFILLALPMHKYELTDSYIKDITQELAARKEADESA